MAQTKNNKNLKKIFPSYKNPPVNEVVCGIRFKTPEKLKIPYIGLLWEQFREEYPNIQHAAPIISIGLEDVATGIPFPRVWFINSLDNQLIQFQLDRFYYNWRRRDDKYPRYTNVIANFENTLKTVRTFFQNNDFGEFIPLELELSYINHIPKGEGWNTSDKFYNIFVDFPWKEKDDRFLPAPYKTTWTSIFQITGGKGTLTVNIKEAIRTTDKIPIIIFELIARKPQDGIIDNKGIRDWFDIAHEWIVKGFADLTDPEIQKIIWEKENA